MRVVENKQGIQFSVNVTDETQIAIMQALLDSANIMYVKCQLDAWYITFKVDAADAGKVKNLISGWYTAMGDIQYALDTSYRN